MRVEIYRIEERGKKEIMKRVVKNMEGRKDEKIIYGEEMRKGIYEMKLKVEEYFEGSGEEMENEKLMDIIKIRFGIEDEEGNYKVKIIVRKW